MERFIIIRSAIVVIPLSLFSFTFTMLIVKAGCKAKLIIGAQSYRLNRMVA